MAKKLVSFILAIVMCLSLSTTALAVDCPSMDYPSADYPSNVTVVNLSENITDQTLQEIVSSTGAYIKKADGTLVPIDATVTIEDIPVDSHLRSATSNEKAYEVTVNATLSGGNIITVPDEEHRNNSVVEADGTLKMTWVDNLGPGNVLKKVTGTLDVKRGTVNSAEVRWGSTLLSALRWHTENVKGQKSFSFEPNLNLYSPVADFSVEFAGDGTTFYLVARSSIFS